MKFQAQKLDLDLELTTLSGEEFLIKGPQSLNAEAAAKAVDLITKEDEMMKKTTVAASLDLVAKSLVGIYGKDEAFWLGNFEPGTLIEIRRYFTATLTSIKKKD